MSSPIVVDGIVYFGSGEGVLYALDARSGTIVWKFKAGKAIYSSPAYFNGKVYFGSLDKGFYAVDSKTGEIVWSVSTSGMITSSPVISRGMVFFGSHDGKLYAVDVQTGAIKWTFQTRGQITQTPAVDDKAVYFSSADGAFYIVSLNGKLIWKFALDEISIWSPSVVAGDFIYVGVNTATYSGIYRLNRRTGGMDVAFDMTHRVFSSPIIVDGVLLVGSKDNFLYAIE
jgi:outer membrane protein assembly factor BamB